MKVASPILTIAALATSTSANTNKDKKRTKKQTISIFHKVNGPKNDATESLLNNVNTARRHRRENQTPKMEKTTKVKRDEIVKRGLAKHGILKKKEKEEASTAAASAQEKETQPDQTVVPSEPSLETAKEEHFEEVRIETTTTTPAPAVAPSVQEVMQKRRQDRVADFERLTDRMAANDRVADFERWTDRMADDPANDRANDYERSKDRRATSTSSPNPSGKRERRTSSTTASGQRTPNPRPKNTRDAHSGKPGPSKRDLKKSKKSSYSSKSAWSSDNSWGSSDRYDCQVRMTNLTKKQVFSDIFWMVHSDKIRLPLWAYGFPAFDDVAKLAQDGDADDLVDFYEDNDEGVYDVDAVRGNIYEGESIFFGIPDHGQLTLATSFIFSNDGFVSIRDKDIEDGAEWYLWGLDAGVEANTQLCWTVQASAVDFPLNSECSTVKEDIADENDNAFIGEGFVHVHNGIHDFEDKKGDLQDFLCFTCDCLDVNSFVEYFRELGFDDDMLLHDDDRADNEKDDDAFLEYVEDNDDEYGNYIIFQIALDAEDFDDFCDELEDTADFLVNTFETLEPQIFDFRTPMMKVELFC